MQRESGWDGGRSVHELEPAGPLVFLPLLFLQAGGMDLSRFGEKIFSSVRSARSLGLLPSTSDRPEVPERAAAAAAAARALAGLPPHEKIALDSNSEEFSSVYGSRDHALEVLEEDFYEEDFDSVKYILEHIQSEESDTAYFEKKATLRLAQLDKIAERLSRHVVGHHEELVKGMQLVMELQQDLKVANVICMNGRRHIASSMQEFSRELVVHSHSKKKQALLDMLPILADLHRALDMQQELDGLVEEGNYLRAFALLPEYLQLLDGYLELSAVKEMSSGIEAWLERTLQKLDALLLGICRTFREESYVTAVDAYALVGDITGLAEKIQSFFMQEVLAETHSLLKDIVLEDVGNESQKNRLTYSDLCERIPESKFRHCLLKTLYSLFSLMCSYYAIMSFKPKRQDFDHPTSNTALKNINAPQSSEGAHIDEDQSGSDDVFGVLPMVIGSPSADCGTQCSSAADTTENLGSADISTSTSSCNSPFYYLRKDATSFVSQTLDRRRESLWQLATSRTSVLLSSPSVYSTSTFQFLRNYEDLNVFVLAGEAFCGLQATEFRNRLKNISENYVAAFHRQNVYALKMVLERENWVKLSAETMQLVSLAGLIGDGAPLIVTSSINPLAVSSIQSKKNSDVVDNEKQKDGFCYWLSIENPFSLKISSGSKELSNVHTLVNGSSVSSLVDAKGHYGNHTNGGGPILDDENEDLLADFIDEDSQLPSRISKPIHPKTSWNDDEFSAQTGSSICLLRLMDKYARLMQKLEIVNVDFFKGICQLFGVFYYFIFEVFGQRDANHTSRVKSSLSKIAQDCDQWIRPQNQSSSSSPKSFNASLAHNDVMPTIPPGTVSGTTFGLKERCVAAETISFIAQILHRSKAHLQSRLFQQNAALVEDFFGILVDSAPDLTEHIHKTTARMLLHINGYPDKIANAKWEVKELGLEHNGYVDLLLGEFKHYKTRLVHGGIAKEVQDLLLGYGLENVAEVLTEGLSRVRRCSDEGRVLMSLDLQVLINGLQHFVSMNVKPKLQIVEIFIKAFYLPETEYVHWARSHQEYSRSQIVGLVNLVATMKGWKRKTRLEVLERIESGNY